MQICTSGQGHEIINFGSKIKVTHGQNRSQKSLLALYLKLYDEFQQSNIVVYQLYYLTSGLTIEVLCNPHHK